MLVAIFNHIKTVFRHKWKVFKCMAQCGHPIQGFLHDWSKFSPTEFIESVKYYQGYRSPIDKAKEVQGYSMAWFHHRGRNPHHSQYWVDISFGEIKPCRMPWKYLLELICDGIAAGQIYLGDKWTRHSPLEHWHTKDYRSFYHPETKAMITKCYEYIDKYGWDSFAYEVRTGRIKY